MWLLQLVLVVFAHATVFCAIYYLRVTQTPGIAQSDIVLFSVPALLAAGASAYLFWQAEMLRAHPAFRLIGSVVTGAVVAFIGLSLGAVIAFNLWGT